MENIGCDGSYSTNVRSPRPAYRLNVCKGDLENMSSPRVSDVGGLSLFLPSNNEPDEEAISAWAGTLKAMAMAGGSGSNGMVPSVADVSVYSSDEFRMYEFKVRRCMRGRSHDWTDCPFAHPGEKARRRDPRKYNYGGTACPDFRKGACRKGDSCEFSHGVFECWLHPARYRTQACKDGRNCKRRVCFFAHTKEQIRLPPSAVAAAVKRISEEESVQEDCGRRWLSPTSTLIPAMSVSPESSPPRSPENRSDFPFQVDEHEAGYGGAVFPMSYSTSALSPQNHRFFAGGSLSPRHSLQSWGTSFSPSTSLSPNRSQSMSATARAPASHFQLAIMRQHQLDHFDSLPSQGYEPSYLVSPSQHRLSNMQSATLNSSSSSCALPGQSPHPMNLDDRSALSEIVSCLQAMELSSSGGMDAGVQYSVDVRGNQSCEMPFNALAEEHKRNFFLGRGCEWKNSELQTTSLPHQSSTTDSDWMTRQRIRAVGNGNSQYVGESIYGSGDDMTDLSWVTNLVMDEGVCNGSQPMANTAQWAS